MNKTCPTPKLLKNCNRLIFKIDQLMGWMPDSELERLVDLPKNKINKVRTGQQIFAIDHVWRIARLFGVPTDWLLNDDDASAPAPIGGSFGVGGSTEMPPAPPKSKRPRRRRLRHDADR